ncbi:fumarylacetoacetate hydrolase family protein [Neobacillus mesonae]|uniref:fumarylacetoacetate hydrolase family protein n=1 Tax=Neobacillus mesonae TaxID=1193713 RepID=UPI002573567F|nr:fumarylacetoacetate hydrolase family protein [Neobacillus mesonae]MED4205355.1 fumarylacetoacetate hydrolase family protein [Neobacillus mesonae]
MSKAKIQLQGLLQEEEVIVEDVHGAVSLRGKSCKIDNLRLDAPVSGTVYGTLLNYEGALEKLGDAVNEPPYKEAPKAPVLYIKPVNTLNGYGMPIPIPSGVPELEMGAALGVVIGCTATNVRVEEALEYVEGYTVVNDVSIPHESVYRPAISQKVRDGFCPVGPWVIDRDAVGNPNSLVVRVYINGELRQENTTANLIRSIEQLIAEITEFMTLQKGDTLLVGVPENAPLACAGDKVRVEIDDVGTLENTIVHEEELAAEGTRI